MVGVAVNPPPGMFGRTGELEILRRLTAQARSGRSAVLVVRGEPGIGKTELLRQLTAEASGFWVARVAGDESEISIPWPTEWIRPSAACGRPSRSAGRTWRACAGR
jgi:hypothetical protein